MDTSFDALLEAYAAETPRQRLKRRFEGMHLTPAQVAAAIVAEKGRVDSLEQRRKAHIEEDGKTETEWKLQGEDLPFRDERLVGAQAGVCLRTARLKLQDNGGDVVEAIMDLAEWPQGCL